MTGGARANILLVDDQEANLLALEAILEPLGQNLVRATSGEEALRQLLHEDFAVILLDVQMPGLDGFETARHIKQRARTRLVPIIFLSAISRELEHQLKGYASGAVDYLGKPFEPTVLLSKVAVFLELHVKNQLVEQQAEQLRERLLERDRAQAALARQAAELERSNADLEQFCAVASHDLQEPLRTTAGFLELLTDRYAETLGEEGRLLLDRATAGVGRMHAMVQDLLDYSRVATTDQQLGTASTAEAVDRALANLSAAVARSGARVDCQELPLVTGDQWLLAQLFENLIGNAIKFRGAASPQVHISAEPDGDDWVFGVRDNGIGVDPRSAHRIFTLFNRLHTREAYPGSGIGLALCKRIVERHGGRIWVEPSLDGQGSTFLFNLPAAV